MGQKFLKKKGKCRIKVQKLTMEDQSYLINPKTGELFIPENGVYYSEKELKSIRDYYDRKKEEEYKKAKNKKISEKYKEYGKFIWYLYELSSKSNLDISPSSLTKLFYLITYMDYEGIIRDNHKIMSSRDIIKVMKLSQSAFYVFINEILDKEIIMRFDNGYKVNDSYFSKGDLQSRIIAENAKNNLYFTKIYINGIRALYNKVSPKQHGKLSMVFKILPYVNRQYNIICSNPLEKDLENIIPLTPKQVCDIVGYNENNMYRLFNEIRNIRFTTNNKTTSLLRFVTDNLKNPTNVRIFINPNVYYGGDIPDSVMAIGEFDSNNEVI